MNLLQMIKLAVMVNNGTFGLFAIDLANKNYNIN